jgi:hypothetical protein
MSDVLELIKKIGEQETSLKNKEFVSPVFYNDYVATKILGILYKFKIKEKTPGWYNITPIDTKTAKTTSSANHQQISTYLSKLPKLRLVLVLRKNNVFLAIPEKNNNLGLNFRQTIPVFLFDDTIQDFEKIICRYDGSNFWFEQVDNSNDLSKSFYLREQLSKFKKIETLNYLGLTFEEKYAYSLRFELDKHLVINAKKENLKKDVEHAGGEFISFLEKNDYYSVTFFVDGNKYTSNVSKDPKHSIITAGICLSGEDSKYDLKSLITVMREGQIERKIHRLNNV